MGGLEGVVGVRDGYKNTSHTSIMYSKIIF